MLDKLLELDKHLLVSLNSLHTPWLDPVMYYTSQMLFWVPLYLFLLWWLFREYKQEAWIAVGGIVLTIVLADQITSTIMKPYFERLRPSQEPSLEGIIHLVARPNGETYKGGLYGFASSHAANTFGTATFFTLLLSQRYKWIYLLFLWASWMTYTRLYLGVHYPADILVGAAIGILSGLAGFRFYKWILSRRRKPEVGSDRR